MLLALRGLFRNPRRTLAVLITIALGTGSIFIFHGFNAGIMNQYRENAIHALYGYGQIFTKGYREKVFEKPWDHWIDKWPALNADLKKTKGVTQVFPRVQFFALLTNGRVTISGRGEGIDGAQEASFFNAINVEQGEMLSTQADGILLGRGLARALDVKPGDRVTVLGNTINGSINGLDLVVSGIFHTGSPGFDDVLFRVQLKQAQTLLDTEKLETVALGLSSLDDWDGAAKSIEAAHPELEVVPFAELDKVYYQHSVDWLKSQFAVIQVIILTIVLLGIFNTVATGILERKKEIGNLRANGESVADIMKLLAWEGLFLGIFGSTLGIAIALLLNLLFLRHGLLMPPAPGLTRQFVVLIELQPYMALQTFAVGVVTAFIGTMIAGWKVAKMQIGEALRST